MPAEVDLYAQWIGGCSHLVPIELDAEQDRDAWVAARISGLGGSEIAAIVGEHPNKSAIDVWLEKVGSATPAFDNDRTRVGRMLEPIVLSWYARGAPEWNRPGEPLVVGKPPTCYHRARPWQRGSPDGFAYYPEQAVTIAPGVELVKSPLRPDHLVEVKTHGWFASRSYETTDDGVPIDVPTDKRIQCAWYMALFDMERCHLVALVDTHIQRTYVIHRDLHVEDYLLEEADRFWREHVETTTPPSPDGSESFGKYLSQRFKTHRPDLISATPEINTVARKLLRCKRAAKKLERVQELCEQQIKQFIGDAAGVKTLYGAVTWKSQRSGKLKVSEALDELYKHAGFTDAEIAAFENRLQSPDHRVLRTPK